MNTIKQTISAVVEELIQGNSLDMRSKNMHVTSNKVIH